MTSACRPVHWTLAALAALSLSGCGIVGVDPTGTPDDPALEHDPAGGRYYDPHLVVTSPELLAEHLPDLAGIEGVRIAEGQFTDPRERAPIPAPDDRWWQAVVDLAPEETGRLLAASRSEASDGGGVPSSPEILGEQEVQKVIVPTLDQEITPCPHGWESVVPALTEPGYAGRTAGGDMLEIAVVCEGGRQLVISARDM